MQLSTNLVSAGLMGVLLVAVVAAIAGVRDWRQAGAPTGSNAGSRSERTYRALSRGAESQLVWTVGFLLLAVGLGGAVVVFLSGGPMSGAAAVLGAAAFGLVVAGFLTLGLYRTARFRGRSSAGAAGVTVWLLATLFVFAVTVNLLLA